MDSSVTSPESVGFSSSRLARIRPVMQSYVDQHGYAGISTMIARQGQVVHFEQVGWLDRENLVPLSPDTIYRIYSMTKPIVCTAFMTLYEEGRFQLSEPLSKFLPAFGNVKVLVQDNATDSHIEDLIRPITIHDLLTHTSGLTYDFFEDSPVCELYRQSGIMSDANSTLEAMVDLLAQIPLAYQPGTRWHYSLSIDVIARLIEVISGQSLQEFMNERLFAPLGMSDTGFSVPAYKRNHIAVMYGLPDVTAHTFSQIIDAWEKGQIERRDVESTYPSDNTSSFARGGHGLFSTTSDYMRFAQMLLNRGELEGVRILAPKIVDFMHMNHVPQAFFPDIALLMGCPGYGFGLGSRVLQNVAESLVPGSIGEYGWEGAAHTYYWVDPQEKLVGVFMSQLMMYFDLVNNDIRTMAYQALVA